METFHALVPIGTAACFKTLLDHITIARRRTDIDIDIGYFFFNIGAL